jgi:hypothetical protein
VAHEEAIEGGGVQPDEGAFLGSCLCVADALVGIGTKAAVRHVENLDALSSDTVRAWALMGPFVPRLKVRLNLDREFERARSTFEVVIPRGSRDSSVVRGTLG